MVENASGCDGPKTTEQVGADDLERVVYLEPREKVARPVENQAPYHSDENHPESFDSGRVRCVAYKSRNHGKAYLGNSHRGNVNPRVFASSAKHR